LGFEHDVYEARVACASGATVEVELCNMREESAGFGLTKRIRLNQGEARLEVHYLLPESLGNISVDLALSPDYLNLLRHGRALLKPFQENGARGWSAGSTAVWVREKDGGPLSWSEPFPDESGHKASFRISTSNREFTFSIGVTRT
jgi:hypothetical protein